MQMAYYEFLFFISRRLSLEESLGVWVKRVQITVPLTQCRYAGPIFLTMKKATVPKYRRLKFMVRPGGFEPPAKSLEGSCSVHLSYGRVRDFRNGVGSNGQEKSDSDSGVFLLFPPPRTH